MNWHTLEASAAVAELESSIEQGLTGGQVRVRALAFGRNELTQPRARSALFRLWSELHAPIVLLLVASAVLAGLLGENAALFILTAVVIAHVLLGFALQDRSDPTAALRKLAIPRVRATRDGHTEEFESRELVPGDIVQLEAGLIVPADIRLLEAVNLRIQEALLTGEPDSIEKHTAALSGEGSPASAQSLAVEDQSNMAFMGSAVTQGHGLGLVVETGMQTELGRMADLLERQQAPTSPLPRVLWRVGLLLVCIAAAAAVLVSVLAGFQPALILSIALAASPAAMPIVIAFGLSAGAQRMFSREVLVLNLPAVAALGGVDVICADKTGTLTENRMTVHVLDVAEHALDLTGQMKRGGSLRGTRGLGAPVQSSLSLAAIGGALCNDAKLIDTGDDHYHTLGDPTDGALIVAAAKMGYWKSALDVSFPRAAELAFDSDRKRMTTVHHLGQYDPEVLAGLEVGERRYLAFTKGNVATVLDLANQIWVDGKARALDPGWRSRIESSYERLAQKGMRVLAVAFRLLDAIPEILQTDLEQNLTLVGLFGMIDPPRDGVIEAIAEARAVGLRPVMITGDHPLAALEIARQLGIAQNGRALRGAEIEQLSLDELKNVIDEVNVFARVAPEHKLKIVRALQARGRVVAMTGDSLNDAPALRAADVGVAMGLSGAEVAREAADIMLFDDSFVSIVAAINEGRATLEGLRKSIQFILSGNLGRVLVMLLAPLMRVILLPTQLLWLSIVIDGLLGFGIARAESSLNATTKESRGALDHIPSLDVFLNAAVMAVVAGALGWWYFAHGLAYWQTIIFAALGFMQIGYALAAELPARNPTSRSVQLIVAAVMSALLQIGVIQIPAFSKFLDLNVLPGRAFLVAAASGLLVFAFRSLFERLSNR